MDRALIIGCGYTGSVLARRLAARGVQVNATTASGDSIPGVDVIALDLLAKSLPPLPGARGAVVYYMAPTLARSYEGQPHLLPMRRLLGALRREAIAGIIYLSSTSVYGDRGGDWIDESSAPAPASPWGKMRLELEQEVLEHGRATGTPACALRLPEIYGPRRGPLQRLRSGYVLRCPERFSNRIYVDDLVLVLEQMGERLDRKLLLVSDDLPVRSREVYSYAAHLLGMPGVPEGGPPAGDANRRALVTESKRCRNTRLKQWLDAPLRYPTFREGLEAQLAAEGERPAVAG
jgi:nucleoside-diphosphate-sugar epimerase